MTQKTYEQKMWEKGYRPRSHNKTPFRKSSQKEVEKRVNWVESLLRQGPYPRHIVIKRIEAKFHVKYGMAMEYIVKARTRLLAALQKEREEHRADSLAFYQYIATKTGVDPEIQLRAQHRIDKLLGLENTVMKVEHSGNLTSTVEIDRLGLDLKTKKRILSAIRATHPAKEDSDPQEA